MKQMSSQPDVKPSRTDPLHISRQVDPSRPALPSRVLDAPSQAKVHHAEQLCEVLQCFETLQALEMG